MEIWKTFLVNRCSKWEASSHGRIKKNGIIYKPFFKGGRKDSRYLCISINNPEHGYIHRIVAKLFIDNPENKKTVNHIDGDKANNMISNLEWATYEENNNHKYESGLFKYKEKEHKIIIFDKVAIKERRKRVLELYNLGFSFIEIANTLSISHQLARLDIVRAKS